MYKYNYFYLNIIFTWLAMNICWLSVPFGLLSPDFYRESDHSLFNRIWTRIWPQCYVSHSRVRIREKERMSRDHSDCIPFVTCDFESSSGSKLQIVMKKRVKLSITNYLRYLYVKTLKVSTLDPKVTKI